MKKFGIAFLIALAILFLLGVLNYKLFNKFGIGCKPDPFPAITRVKDTWTSALEDRGWRQAENKKPDNIPDQRQPPVEEAEPVIYGYGTVQLSGNSGELPVEITGIETPDGKKWMSAWVDGRQVIFEHLDWLDVCYEDHTDLSLLVECAFIDGPDFGAGAAYEPLHFWGMNAGLFLTCDVNQDILTAPDWAAGGVRVSRDWWVFTGGADLGYRLGEEAGLHTGISGGVELNF